MKKLLERLGIARTEPEPEETRPEPVEGLHFYVVTTPGDKPYYEEPYLLGPRGAESYTVGCAWDQATIVAPGVTFLSRYHARIYYYRGYAFVEDLGSTCGTFVNGDRLRQPRPLKDGDRVSFGSTDKGLAAVFWVGERVAIDKGTSFYVPRPKGPPPSSPASFARCMT